MSDTCDWLFIIIHTEGEKIDQISQFVSQKCSNKIAAIAAALANFMILPDIVHLRVQWIHGNRSRHLKVQKLSNQLSFDGVLLRSKLWHFLVIRHGVVYRPWTWRWVGEKWSLNHRDVDSLQGRHDSEPRRPLDVQQSWTLTAAPADEPLWSSTSITAFLLSICISNVPNIRFVFASVPNNGLNSLFVFGRIASS